MENSTATEESMTVFYVGHHENRRSFPVTAEVLAQAHDCNYDIVTTPITTASYHSDVLSVVSSFIAEASITADDSVSKEPVLPPLKASDTSLSPQGVTGQVLATTSSWIDLSSPDPLISKISHQVFSREIAFAAFCGVNNVIVQGPKLRQDGLQDSGLAQYAQSVKEALALGPYMHLQILLPLAPLPNPDSTEIDDDLSKFARDEYVSHRSNNRNEASDLFEAWEAWNLIRTVCKYHARLSVALSLPRSLPPIAIQSRWYSEPLRVLVIPATSFLKNAKGYPVLSKPHQALIYRYMRLRQPPWILLGDVGPIPGLESGVAMLSDTSEQSSTMRSVFTLSESGLRSPTPAEASKQQKVSGQQRYRDPTPHLSYIRHLQRNQPQKPAIERFGAGYQDYLQVPLQPLADNLESVTYEVFETDPVKYEWYERAIAQALAEWSVRGKTTSSSTDAVVVAVAGAGRGPLVTRVLRASEFTAVPVQVWALEKNPNAYVLLQRRNESEWMGKVRVLNCDMRTWNGPELADGSNGKVDILVSELLGSFADNELSPECLDGVQHVLNVEHGISIPASYSAHLTPIASPRLHAAIEERAVTDKAAHETPYVVMLHAIDYLSTISPRYSTPNPEEIVSPKPEVVPRQPFVQETWSFKHPHRSLVSDNGLDGGGSVDKIDIERQPNPNEHNARFAHLRFPSQNRGICHGLAGYFETTLYDGLAGPIELSTNPITMEEKSKDMISWFPIYFPLKVPMYIPERSELVISMWRQTDARKVWYEWLVEAFTTVGNRHMRIGVSDLHSSVKSACLM